VGLLTDFETFTWTARQTAGFSVAAHVALKSRAPQLLEAEDDTKTKV
jgi:hypothetical protein